MSNGKPLPALSLPCRSAKRLALSAFNNRSSRLYAANFNTNTVTVIQTGRK